MINECLQLCKNIAQDILKLSQFIKLCLGGFHHMQVKNGWVAYHLNPMECNGALFVCGHENSGADFRVVSQNLYRKNARIKRLHCVFIPWGYTAS